MPTIDLNTLKNFIGLVCLREFGIKTNQHALLENLKLLKY